MAAEFLGRTGLELEPEHLMDLKDVLARTLRLAPERHCIFDLVFERCMDLKRFTRDDLERALPALNNGTVRVYLSRMIGIGLVARIRIHHNGRSLYEVDSERLPWTS